MRHRAALIERRSEGDHAVTRDDAIRRLQPGDVAQRRRLANRAAGVRAGSRRSEHRGHSGSRTTRRAAWNARGVPWVAHFAEVRRLVRRTHGEFVHVRFAENHGAGSVELGNDGSVVGTDEVRQHARSACRQPALAAEDVLLGDRDTGQRADITGGNLRVGSAGLGQALVGIDGNEGVDVRVIRLDAVEEQLRQFDAGNLFAGERLGELGEVALDHSITFGTR